MPIPEFLFPKPIVIGSPPAASALGGAGPAQHRKTNFRIDRQEQDNWCWSAVGVSIERFYDHTQTRTQCELANTALGRQDCCTDGADDAGKCDKPWYLDRVLRITGNLEDVAQGALPFADLQTRINSDLVVGCRIGWYDGGGHFAVVIGWHVAGTGRTYIDIADPIWMETQVPYDDFPSLYQTGGDWTHSYLTGPATAGGAVAQADIDDPDLLGA
ncbi:hypothetical protein [Methylobacterium nodulans]|uniref:Peptidase C39-like domain-containing protein n=1 Tax=Methylobacterium nodulans (strain LMG 21967 / CNCM I-2342 / ORS 2060) TaxID=460265 RepID=B8IEZ9_METNO|nr:hypothetical protein [Methylobacterium nodulans]ACL55710.1 conserved hypothetical protein [Methylobacterium nodulans ORS 2060]